jgi:NAD(P)-dependent dehydrogenase (short-subunit alcohol dehydrogenase family)
MDLARATGMRSRKSRLNRSGVGAAAGLLAAAAIAAAVERRRRLPRTRTALITGASRGLGLALAREYLRRGAAVAICARDAEELERAKTLLDGGRPVLAIPCDVTEPAQVAELVAMVRQHYGAIDTLVNNAGVIQVGPREHMTARDYERALATHLWGPLRLVEAVLPEMRERRSGRIVNVASLAGLVPVPHMLPYTTSKFALVGWSEGLGAELARDGIRVTTVCPSLIRAGSARNAEFKGRHREEYAWFSISDSLPLLSMNVDRAARRIVSAGERGQARLVLPVLARLPVAAHALWPGLALAVLRAIGRRLPAPGGVGPSGRRGRDSASRWSPSWLTVLDERAARRNNEG